MIKKFKFVTDFLERNGFEKINNKTYKNDKCKIIINDTHYEVTYYAEEFLEYMSFYTESLNFPALLGNLIWHEFIDRDFKR